jgi:hypothetical protein
MVNFCARFIPNLATLAKPLRDLTLTSETTMAYYNPSHKIEVLVDASPVGLGAILVQYPTTRDHSASPRIVSYASRVLTPVEIRYSQIEREALAIVWSCHKFHYFHLYLYGTQFSVITDHRPLERLFNDPQSKPPARIKRWLLKVQSYRFNVQYQPGSDNPADFMSRHPLPSSPTSNEE